MLSEFFSPPLGRVGISSLGNAVVYPPLPATTTPTWPILPSHTTNSPTANSPWFKAQRLFHILKMSRFAHQRVVF